MNIKQIVKTTAMLMAREDVVNYLANQTQSASRETLETVDLLTRLTGLVITELAEGLIPLKAEKQFEGVLEVPFSQLDYNTIEILAVKGLNGKDVFFTVTDKRIISYEGITKVVYAYSPDTYDLNSEVGTFTSRVSVGALSYGVAAEYCIVSGRFEEAVNWNKRYVTAIENLLTPKNRVAKGRRFV